MSRKHSTKHLSRGKSNYPRRLEARGVSSAQARQLDPMLSDNKRASSSR